MHITSSTSFLRLLHTRNTLTLENVLIEVFHYSHSLQLHELVWSWIYLCSMLEYNFLIGSTLAKLWLQLFLQFRLNIIQSSGYNQGLAIFQLLISPKLELYIVTKWSHYQQIDLIWSFIEIGRNSRAEKWIRLQPVTEVINCTQTIINTIYVLYFVLYHIIHIMLHISHYWLNLTW